MLRGNDIADYLTWARGSETRFFLPQLSCAVAHRTRPHFSAYVPAFPSVPLYGNHADCRISYAAFLVFLLYLLASYSLFACFRLFTDGRKQALGAFLAILCSIPIPALAILPVSVLTAIVPAIKPALGRWGTLPGLGDFVFWSSDGFFHGIEGGTSAAFGTAASLLTFAILAKYLKTDEKRYLHYAAVAIFAAGLLHPFEVFVMCGASAAAFFWLHGREWRRALGESALLGICGAAGVSHFVIMGLRYQWLRDSIDLARRHRSSLATAAGNAGPAHAGCNFIPGDSPGKWLQRQTCCYRLGY